MDRVLTSIEDGRAASETSINAIDGSGIKSSLPEAFGVDVWHCNQRVRIKFGGIECSTSMTEKSDINTILST